MDNGPKERLLCILCMKNTSFTEYMQGRLPIVDPWVTVSAEVVRHSE